MKKADELADPTSCINKAADDEPVFVLRAKDYLAPFAVRYWATAALASRLHEPERCAEAERLATAMEAWRKANTPAISPTTAWPFPSGQVKP